MGIEESDLRDAEFMRKLRAGDFSGAHKALDRLAEEHSMREESWAGWKAHIYDYEGKPEDAGALLDTIVVRDDIPGKFSRHHRARILIRHGRLDEARQDLESLLDDPQPRIAALHVGCRLQIAYIFAMQGDQRFEIVFSEIPDGADYFIKDEFYGKDDLQRLYAANTAKSMRRAPR